MVADDPARPVLAPLLLRGREFVFGSRTFVMGILNVTPDSFSGDGLLDPGAEPATTSDARRIVETAVAQALRMVDEGADILDVGGESTRPGHEPVSEAEELARVSRVVGAIRERVADIPISIDTSKAAVADAALAAGADILNDVAAVTSACGIGPRGRGARSAIHPHAQPCGARLRGRRARGGRGPAGDAGPGGAGRV